MNAGSPSIPGRASPTRSILWNIAGWMLVGLLILLEFSLFRRFLLREVVWAYPPNTDQLAYLQQSYETYEQMKREGVVRAIADSPAAPQGALLQIEGALLYRVIGASRFNALLVNFLHFAALQCFLVWAVRGWSRWWCVALIALGLLLTALSPFYRAGGMSDFRMDFAALCLYGIFICLVVRSGMFARWGWCVAAGVAGALLVGMRFICAAYLFGVFAAMLALFALVWWRNRTNPRGRIVLRQIVGWLIAAAVIGITTTPVLWSRRVAIHDYYIVGHITGAEKAVRAAETGTTHFWAALLYYPGVLIKFHAGLAFVVVAAVVLLSAAVIRIRSRTVPAPVSPSVDAHRIGDVFAFALACFAVPLVLLTLDVSKSPVVASILIVPLVWLVVIGLVALDQPSGSNRTGARRKCFEVALAIFAIVCGVRTQLSAYKHDRLMSRRYTDVNNITLMSDLMAARAKSAGWESPMVFNGDTADYLYSQVVKVLTYERHGYLLDIGDQFGTVTALPEPQVFKLLAESDFVILTQRTAPAAAYEYPFDREMARLHPALMAYCRQNLERIAEYDIFNRHVTLFMRRTGAKPVS